LPEQERAYSFKFNLLQIIFIDPFSFFSFIIEMKKEMQNLCKNGDLMLP